MADVAACVCERSPTAPARCGPVRRCGSRCGGCRPPATPGMPQSPGAATGAARSRSGLSWSRRQGTGAGVAGGVTRMTRPWSVNATVRTDAPGSWRIRLNAVVSRTRAQRPLDRRVVPSILAYYAALARRTTGGMSRHESAPREGPTKIREIHDAPRVSDVNTRIHRRPAERGAMVWRVGRRRHAEPIDLGDAPLRSSATRC